MLTWVIYDISDDKTRSKVANLCSQMGLYRVQKSIFLGPLESEEREELRLQFADLIDLKKDRVYFSVISKDEFERIEVVGRDFDRKLVGNMYDQIIF